MIRKISAMCSKNAILFGKLHNVNDAILTYGFEIIITSTVGLFILILLSLLIGSPMAWLFFLIGFAVHRTFAGGYHADSRIGCFGVTSIMFLIGTITSIIVEWNVVVYLAIEVFSAVLVLTMAPLEAENKPLSQKRFQQNRKRSVIVVCINLFLSVFFAVIGFVCEEANLYFAGIFFATFSLVMGKIKKYQKGG